jgi:hypothetical protein
MAALYTYIGIYASHFRLFVLFCQGEEEKHRTTESTEKTEGTEKIEDVEVMGEC